MKKLIAVVIGLLFMTIMSFGCVSIEMLQESPSGNGKSSYENAYEINAIALNEDGGRLLFYLLRGINSGMVSVNTNNAELAANDGTIINESDFRTGQLVTITYDGTILESYPGQINACYGIGIIGEAEKNEVSEALSKYRDIYTVERTIYYIYSFSILDGKTVPVMYGDLFGEWKKANNVPDEVMLLKLTSEDNAYTEIAGDVVNHSLATVLDLHLDLSKEFLTYLSSMTFKEAVVSSLVKTMIGDDPFPEDTGVYITVNGEPLVVGMNDFSGRLVFDIFDTLLSRDAIFLYNAGLVHDGSIQTIKFENIDESENVLSVINAEGKTIWQTNADFPHPGLNTLFLTKIDGKEYLTQYNPVVYHGFCTFSFRVFSLDKNGSEVIMDSGEVAFSVNPPVDEMQYGLYEQDIGLIKDFYRSLDKYLQTSELLVNTDWLIVGGILPAEYQGRVYGTQKKPIPGRIYAAFPVTVEGNAALYMGNSITTDEQIDLFVEEYLRVYGGFES